MSINQLIQQLQELSIRLRSQLDQSEAHIVSLNHVVGSIADLNLVTEQVLLGHVVHMRDYTPSAGITDSGIVLQAALSIPGGLGIVTWDTDVYARARLSPDGLHGEGHHRFMEYASLDPAIRALLLPHVESLLTRLTRLASPFG